MLLFILTPLFYLFGLVASQELIQSGDTWTIRNAKAGTVVDLSKGDNTTVTGWALNNGTNQHWTTLWSGSGWNIQNVYTQSYLAVANGTQSAGNGTALVGQAEPFDWDIWHDDENNQNYRLYLHGTDLNADLWNFGNQTSGDPITLWSAWNGTHQTWSFQRV